MYRFLYFSEWKHRNVLRTRYHWRTRLPSTSPIFQKIPSMSYSNLHSKTISKVSISSARTIFHAIELKFNYSTISQKCNHNLSIVLMKCGVFCRYIRVSTGPGCHFVFAVIRTPEMPKNNVGFSLVQRKWAAISVNQDIDVKAFRFNTSSSTEFLDTVTLEVDFLAKKT